MVLCFRYRGVRIPRSEIIPVGNRMVSQPDPDNTGGGSMKARLFLFSILTVFVFFASPVFAGGSKDSVSRSEKLVIYTYDSFISEWGAGPELTRLFEKKTGIKCTMIDEGDGSQILSRVVIEKDNPQADIVLGIDNNQMKAVREAGVFESYKPENADEIIAADLRLADDWLVTPYDWSYFAMVYDTESSVPAPSSLEELANPVYAKKIILMDPRTSTPGMGFVAWTLAVFGNGYEDYWKALKPNILTMAPGWSTGYGLFTSGEAPLVISYTTSPAYHVEYGEGERFQALIFDEGHPLQIEGAAVLKNAPNKDGARLFLDFLISPEAQAVLPLTQWMYPVNTGIKMPDSYRAAPMASSALTVDNDELSAAIENVMGLLAE